MASYGNPLNAFATGFDQSQGVFDQMTRQRAGNALARGDTSGGMNAFYKGGMIDEGRKVQTDIYGQEDREKSAKKEEWEFYREVATTLKRVGTERGPEELARAYDSLTPVLVKMPGSSPQAVAQMREQVLKNPQILDAIVGAANRELQAVNLGSGGVGVFDKSTGDFKTIREPEYKQDYVAVPQGGKLVPVPRGVAPQGQPAPAGGDAGGGLPLAAIAEAAPNAVVTSGYRSPEDNQRVGGVPNSRHLDGQALDLVPGPGETMGQLYARLSAIPGVKAINEGDHIHVQPAGQGGDPAGTIYGAPKPEDPLKPLQAENLQAQIDERKAKAADKVQKREASVQAAQVKAAAIGATVDKALSMANPTTTGFVGARLRGIEGTDAYDLAREVETIKANLGFAELQEMRANSPTGGALGQVAVQELVALQATVANLDPNQSEKNLKANLRKVKQHYNKWLQAVQGGPQAAAESAAASLPPQAVQQLKPGKVTTFANGQRWTLRNGKPAQVK